MTTTCAWEPVRPHNRYTDRRANELGKLNGFLKTRPWGSPLRKDRDVDDHQSSQRAVAVGAQQVSLHFLFGFLSLVRGRMQIFNNQIPEIKGGNSIHA